MNISTFSGYFEWLIKDTIMFSATQSPAEIAYINPDVTGIFNRYNISADELLPLSERDLNVPLLVGLCNQLTDPNIAQGTFLEEASMSDLVDYLKRSHTYYSEKKLPEIINGLQHLMVQSNSGYALLHTAIRCLEDYLLHLNEHFMEEEANLFPLVVAADQPISYLSGAELVKRFEYFEAHSIQHEVIDSLNYHQLVEKCLSLYKKTDETSFQLGVLREQLNVFRKDIELHEWIEEVVLIPRLKEKLSELHK